MEATPPTATGTYRRPDRSVNRIRTMASAVLLSFVLGGALAFYLAWSSGWLSDPEDAAQEQAAIAALPDDPEMAAAVPTETALAAGSPATMGMRIEDLERRLNRLDLQAEAASGHAARAEGLLVAFAARRLIERGAPLGYLENQLQLRFGNAQPNAVRTIINGARNPVTLDSLRLGLETMSNEAVQEPDSASTWDRVQSELQSLFVLRKASAPSPQPVARMDRAQQLLEDGRIEAASALVERLPNAERTAPWLADARRYVAVHDALDLIETAALLEPRQLINSEGRPVRQGSPAAPSSRPTAAIRANDSEAAAVAGD
ncbi:hypothetical protein [Croceicoccus naphthovorans]|nr:hypothetical protein [Croceicoccus naphthovorans]